MTGPIGTISGLSSGIQWRDLIDQILKVERARSLDPLTARQTALNRQSTAWTTFQGLVDKVRSTALALRDPTAFDVLSAAASRSATSGRDLIAASATAAAAPGSYGVEVLTLARAEKLGGNFVADTSAALGVSGSFTLNGAAITIAADDSLVGVRDKINAANTGASASGVTATIISTAAGAHLVLASSATGAAGIEAVDGPGGALQSLGFIDGTTSANVTAAGATRTYRVSSPDAAIGTLLGIEMPAATTISVGGTAVAVDLAIDSVASIADKINAATGNPSAARVQSETFGGKTFWRLVTDAAVATDAGVNLADSTRALSVLGFTTPGHAGVTQVLRSANTFVDGGTALAATGATLLTALEVNNQSLGIATTDTVTIAGTRGDGTPFSATMVVGAATTMQDLLDAVNAAAAGARAATASLSDGRIVLTDGASGDSQLALAVTVTKAGGGTISLGAFSTANGGTAGLSRQITAGTDAQVRIDGQLVTRAANTVSDAIPGVTLNLLAAEPNTSVTLTLERDTNAIVQKVQDLVAAYNAVKSFVATYTAEGGTLAHNGALRGMSATLTNSVLGSVTGLSGAITTAAVTGLQHDKNGVLSLDVPTFTSYLKTNFADVKRVFSLTGTTSDAEVTFLTAGTAAKPTTSPYAVTITQAATQASVTGAVWTTYVTAGLPDTMTITDASTGTVGAITIANGDTIAETVQKLNSLFAIKKMQLTATVTGDSRVKITATEYGASAGFSVAYTPGSGGDGTAALGIAAQAYEGLDVAGTINGVAATGRGQVLTGAADDASAGIMLRYSGTTARAAGTVALSIGVGGALANAAFAISDSLTGSATIAAANAKQEATNMQQRLADVQRRLDARRATLMSQFLAMEAALSKAQAIGGALTSQINALQSTRR